MNSDTINNVAGVARSALLVTVNIGLYSGRKKDSRTQAEVVHSKNSGSARAASVYKSLFADCAELDAIVKFQARARKRHYMLTLPWNDNGVRLLPGTALLDYQAEMRRYEQEYSQLCQAFLVKYDTLVAAAAFQLGALFDRSEYPTRDKVAAQFHFTVSYDPVPTSGDFRLDIESQVQRELVAQYEARMVDQLAAAQNDAWTRVYEALGRFRDRLTLNEDGTRRVFQETMVSNAQELCEVLTHLNITKDPKLEAARAQLQRMLDGLDVKELRKEEGVRLEVLHTTNKILDAFDWGQDEETTTHDTL
jgi:hypothetical protein